MGREGSFLGWQSQSIPISLHFFLTRKSLIPRKSEQQFHQIAYVRGMLRTGTHIRFLLLAILGFIALGGFSQNIVIDSVESDTTSPYIVNIKHFTAQDGLPTNVINCGMQGRDGFLWFGTREGLVRYDGNEFKTFNKENHGLYSDNIIGICQIEDDWLWVLCCRHTFDNRLGGYINLFNTKTWEVKTLDENLIEGGTSVVTLIMQHTDTSLLLRPEGAFVYQLISPRATVNELSAGPIDQRDPIVAPDGKIWISGNDGTESTLSSFEANGKPLSTFRILTPNMGIFPIVGFDSIGQPIGFMVLDSPINTMKITRIVDGQPQALNEAIVGIRGAFSYEVTDEQAIWFRHPNGNIYKTIDGNDPELIIKRAQLGKSGIQRWQDKIFADNLGTIWSISGEGITKITVRKKLFKNYLTEYAGKQYHQIRGICKGADGALYVISQASYVFRIDAGGHVQSIQQISALSIEQDSVFVYYSSGGGNNRFRLHRYDTRTREITSLLSGFMGEIPWILYHDTQNGGWWFGGANYLQYCTSTSGNCTDESPNIFGPNPGNISTYHIFRERDTLWFVTAAGLYWLDIRTKTSGSIEIPDTSESRMSLSDVHHVHRDGNHWWIATNGSGLIKWDRSDGTFTNWTKSDGLSSNVLYACLEDKRGNLWISSNYGLMQFNKVTANIKTYTTDDGLTHNEFNRTSWYQDEDGTMYFGGMDGLVSFNPEDFTFDQADYHPPLRITSLLQYNNKRQTLEDLTVQLGKTGEIELRPNNSFFTLQFALLDFQDDIKRFAYRLDDPEYSWQDLSENTLQLGNLPYGKHMLLIKGQNQAGQWSSSVLEIPVIVLTPFYLKWWVLLLAVLLFISSIIGIIRWRTWRINRERKRLQERVREQTGQLQKSLEEKEVLLKEVHHRVKNNLQVISSLLNLELKGDQNPATIRLIREARHRIKSMALIHKNLYQFDDLSHIMVDDYLHELLSGLDKSYKGRQQSITYTYDTKSIALDVDTAIPLGLIITELVSNSYKYAFQGLDAGQIDIILDKNGDSINLMVSDNGIGLPKELHDLNGESLGLRLVRLLTKQLKGSVQIKNELGTSFIFEIPTKLHEN